MTTDIATTHTPSNGALAHNDEPRRFVDRLLTSKRADIETALEGSGVDFDLFRLGVARAIMKEPNLEKIAETPAGRASLAGAVLDCARLGLVCSGYDAQAAIITRGGLAQLMVMVGGLCDVAERNRGVVLRSQTVRAGEVFEYDAIADTLKHEIKIPRPKQTVAAWAAAIYPDGRVVFEIMEKDELDAARKAGSGGGAWTQWEYEMQRKTVKRRLVRARRLIAPSTWAKLETDIAVEGDRDDEMPVADSKPVDVRAATLALAGAAPLAIAAGTDVTAEARLADHDAAEDARLERLRAQAETQAAPKPTQKEQSTIAEEIRATLAALIRKDDETEAQAREHANAELGKVTAATFDTWVKRGRDLIADREAPRND
jgi:recombinational DNA repair protein RecT